MPNLAAKITALEHHRAEAARLEIEIANDLNLTGASARSTAAPVAAPPQSRAPARAKTRKARVKVTPAILAKIGRGLLSGRKHAEVAREAGVSLATVNLRKKDAIAEAKRQLQHK